MRKIGTGTAAVLAIVANVTAPAQEYPAKPMRIIIGFPPGGATDLVAPNVIKAAGIKVE